MADGHTHCPCNGVWLCTTCHTWAHDQPFAARPLGYIVLRHVAEPGAVPITAYYGTVTLLCNGKPATYIE